MKNLGRRTIAVICILMVSAPFVYLAFAIRSFKENPIEIAPCYRGLVDCLDTPVGRPLEFLMKANGVTVEYLHCARYEGSMDGSRAATDGHLDTESNFTCAPFIAVTNKDKAHELAQELPGFSHEPN